MNSPRSLCIILLLAACIGCGGGTAESVPPTVVFTSIGPLAGDISSQVTAVSANGAVVVGTSTSASGKSQAFRWSAANGLRGLGFMAGGTSSSAKAISADGMNIVGDGDAAGASFAVFRWNVSTGLVQLKALADSKLCVAGGVSGDGNVIVGTCVTANNSAFRWTETTGMVALGQFGTGSNRTSNALAISGDASTIVGMGHPVLTGAVMWNSIGEGTILGFLPGDTSAAATATSRDGSVVVGFSTQPSSHPRAFRWTRQTGITALASSTDPSLSDVVATAISGDGRVTVGWEMTSKGETALLWDEVHGIRRIEDLLKTDYGTRITGWVLSRATAISDDGRTVVGMGVNPNGIGEGWVLKFPN
jgi:probable HAF family extracellular repeat protein